MNQAECYIFAGLGGIACAGGVIALEDAVDALNLHNPELDAKWRLHQAWNQVANTILGKNGKPGYVCLMGHSMGVLSALYVARRLQTYGISVDYLVVLDPTAMPKSEANLDRFKVPSNVKNCDQFLASRGYPALVRRWSPDGKRGGILTGGKIDFTETYAIDHVGLPRVPAVRQRILARVTETFNDAYRNTVPASTPITRPEIIIPASTFVYQAPRRTVNELIWHCTADPEGRNNTVEAIRRFHITPKPEGRGWKDIGYHFVVYRDGSIHIGRSNELSGAHVADHNRYTIGCSYVGGMNKSKTKPKDTRTPAQRAAILALTKAICGDKRIKKISGHNEYSSKACPSFHVYDDAVGNIPGFKKGVRI